MGGSASRLGLTGVNNVYIHVHWRTGSSTAVHVPPRSSGGSTPPDALFSFIFHKWNTKNHLLYVYCIVSTYVFQIMPWMEYSPFRFSFLSAFVSSFSMTSKGPWKSPCWSLAPSLDQFWFCTRDIFLQSCIDQNKTYVVILCLAQ